MNEDIKGIEDRLNTILHKCNLDSKVSVKEVKRWIQELDFEDKLVPFNILTGLLDDQIIEQPELVHDLLSEIIKLYHVLPLPSLDGETYKEVLKKREEQNIPVDTKVIQKKFPLCDWIDPYHKALDLMHQKRFWEARENYDMAFQKLLESQTTDPKIYQVFCNAGLSYLFSGQPYIGSECIKIARSLNPKYIFAREQLEKLNRGEFSKLIEFGYFLRIKKSFEEWERRPSPLIFNKVMNWSEERIVKKLSSFGITVDKKEFRAVAKTVNNAEDLADKLFYSKGSVSPENEDFIWMAACALWEKYCPDEQSINGFSEIIHSTYECAMNIDLLNRDGTTLNNDEIKRLKDHLQRIHEYVLSDKKNLLHDWHQTFDVNDSCFELKEFLILLLSIHPLKEQALQIVDRLRDVVPHPDWDTIMILHLFQEDANKAKELFDTIQKQNPYDCYIANDIGLYYLDKEEYNAAENYFMKALSIVDKRAKDNVHTIESTCSTIYEDYSLVLENLQTVHLHKKTDNKQKKWLHDKRKQIEKNKEQLSNLPQIEKMNKDIIESMLKSQLEEVNESYPRKYYEFLSQFNINFETDELVQG